MRLLIVFLCFSAVKAFLPLKCCPPKVNIFNQCVCPSSCSAPTSKKNLDTCGCECPSRCSAPKSVQNLATCECVCPAGCPSFKPLLNTIDCSCQCVACSAPKVPNKDTCACQCPNTCSAPKVQDPDTCECKCPAPKIKFNNSTNSCDCPWSPIDCPKTLRYNPDSCKCECATPKATTPSPPSECAWFTYKNDTTSEVQSVCYIKNYTTAAIANEFCQCNGMSLSSYTNNKARSLTGYAFMFSYRLIQPVLTGRYETKDGYACDYSTHDYIGKTESWKTLSCTLEAGFTCIYPYNNNGPITRDPWDLPVKEPALTDFGRAINKYGPY